MIQFCKKYVALILVITCYIKLTFLSLNNCYFWDNIHYTPVFAHIFQNGFSGSWSSIFTDQFIASLGFYPPLLGFITAILWKIFGYHLWVSHLFFLVWFFLLAYNLWKILLTIMPKGTIGWAFIIVMLEPTVLSQFSIASVDFILFTAFIISFRAIIENKRKLLFIGLFFLCGIHVRGLFAGAILMIVDYYFQYFMLKKQVQFTNIIKIATPYLIVFSLISTYFVVYLNAGGGLIASSPYSTHYEQPGLAQIFRNIAVFSLRSLENGRFLIWGIGIMMLYLITKRKLNKSYTKLIILFLVLHLGVYLVFIFITQMPFCQRYFLPHYFTLTILAVLGIWEFISAKKAKIIFSVILLLEITGNLWIYPEIIAKSWDCTLAHLPYYELRAKCFNYIDSSKIDYKDISAGFNLYGSREEIELRKNGKLISNETVYNKYFIYSNISNLNDSLILDFKNPKSWEPIKKFEKGFVNIIIYKRTCKIDSIHQNRN